MSNYTKRGHTFQRGIVSLFVVIFSALLLTVLAVGFIRLMIQEQQAAANNDLSQSAYDSAVAGVEDGKRVLKKCTDGDSDACNAITSQQCNTVTAAKVISNQPDEIKIRSNGSTADTSMNQAYTCVKINSNTDDVLVNLKEGRSIVVPLRAAKEFSKVRVSWMHRNTGGNTYLGGDAETLKSPTEDSQYESLPPKANWNDAAASLLRTQTVLPPNGSFDNAGQFDSAAVSTKFLRPAGVNGGGADVRVPIGLARAAGSAEGAQTNPSPIACSGQSYKDGGYACRALLEGTELIPAGSNMAFIRLTSLYRDTSVRIEMLDKNDEMVQFNGVQPEIDSTGRASNVFRRIASRVSLSMGMMPYPEYAVDTTNSLCKDFYVTASPTGAGSSSDEICKIVSTP